MPEGAVYVGRPTIYGNPFRIVPPAGCCPHWDVEDDNGVRYLIDHDRAHEPAGYTLSPTTRAEAAVEAVRLFYDDLTDWFGGRLSRQAGLADAIRRLRGRDLCCWCPLDQPCHADVLLRIANPAVTP